MTLKDHFHPFSIATLVYQRVYSLCLNMVYVFADHGENEMQMMRNHWDFGAPDFQSPNDYARCTFLVVESFLKHGGLMGC